MSNINNGGPAFPSGESYYTTDLSGNRTRHGKSPQYKGISMRDYFAAKAMANYINGPVAAAYPNDSDIARWSYEMADAMLAERDVAIKEQKNYDQLRAAKCVIALQSLSDDALEGDWNFKDFSAYVRKLEKDRNELLEALEQMVSTAERVDCWESFPSAPIEVALNAIAKARGEQDE